jgi:DNA-binding transcriptional LysR family regulator
MERARWVMPSSKFKLRSEIDKFFEIHQLKGRILFETDVMASMVQAVVDEVGLAFLPMLYCGTEIRNKSIRVLGPKDGFWKYHVWLVCHQQNETDTLIKALAVSFKDICRRSDYCE